MSAPPSLQNLSSSTPAAYAGRQLAAWQKDSNSPRNMSAQVPWTGGVEVKTGNYNLGAGDCGLLLVADTNGSPPISFTFHLPATIPSEGSPPVTFTQWCVFIQNIGPGVLTIDPNGKQLDKSTSSITLNQGQGVYISTDGSNYFSERGSGGGGSSILLETNGTNNGSQVKLNLKNGSNVTVTDDGSGGITIAAPTMVGDSGSGGTAGAVPAPPAGAAAAGKFLKADGTFAVPPGGSGLGGGGMWKLSPPSLGSFSWANQGGASAVSGANFLSILAPGAGSTNLRILYKACPSTPWDLYALIQVSGRAATDSNSGLVVYDGTKVITFGLQIEGTMNNNIPVFKFNTVTSFNGTSNSDAASGIVGPMWFHIANDGTNLSFSYSFDGVSFYTLNSQAITAFLSAATYYGLYANSENSQPASVTCLSFASSMTAQ